jgi:outer membrane cobalamin receptor
MQVRTIAMQDDSTKSYQLDTVSVTGERDKSNSIINYNANTIFDKNIIQTIQPLQLSEMLTYSPGVYIRNLGGLESMKLLSIRGTGTARSLIMLDGIPLNSSQNGSFDLSNIATSMLNTVEIMRGGGGAIWGSNAIGGIVNIRTDWQKQNSIKANISYGSFNERTATLIANASNATCYISGNLQYVASDGDYPFTFNQFGEEHTYYRQNADYKSINTGISGRINGSDWNVWTRAMYNHIDKGIPGAILQGQVNSSSERLTEDNVMLMLNGQWLGTNNDANLSAMWKYDNMLYENPVQTADPNSRYQSNDITLNASYNHHFMWNITSSTIATATHSRLVGDMLDKAVDGKVTRSVFSLGEQIDKTFNLNGQKLNANVSARFDYVDKNTNAFSSAVGLSYIRNVLPLELRANYSHNFRLPTFNEMYYRNYGTKDLLPETSDNINIGATYTAFDILNISVDGYYIWLKNMITAIPTSPISWSARNLDKSLNNGIEFSFSLSKNFHILKQFNVSYTLQQAIDKSPSSITYNKQIPYTPNEMLNYLFCIDVLGIDIGSKGEYSSFAYTQADNANNAILQPYWIFDVFVMKAFIIDEYSLQVRLECKNIFNRQYEIISRYIMPGRSFRIGITFDV